MLIPMKHYNFFHLINLIKHLMRFKSNLKMMYASRFSTISGNLFKILDSTNESPTKNITIIITSRKYNMWMKSCTG